MPPSSHPLPVSVASMVRPGGGGGGTCCGAQKGTGLRRQDQPQFPASSSPVVSPRPTSATPRDDTPLPEAAIGLLTSPHCFLPGSSCN